MDSREFIEKYSPFIRQNWLPLAFGILGVILFSYGLIALLGSSNSSKDIIFEKGSETSLGARESAKINSKEILADIEGAVVSPGVYRLNQDARVKDLLIAASGLSGSADRNWVAKNLNLAAKLIDGTKVYIPFLGEKAQVPGVYSGLNTDQESSLVNINTASEKDLDSLPGVGPSTVQKIINGRPYGAVEELLSKKIVTSSVFEKIKNIITIY